MIRNYFKMAWRNLLKDRQFTFLNLAGLSTGLACTLLIWLWVMDELNMDKYNTKDKQLYQVMQNIQLENGVETAAFTPGPLANSLAAEIPEVEHAVTVVPASWFSSKGIISYKDKHIKTGGQFISKDYCNVFTCTVLEGNKNNLLPDKQAVAISDHLAAVLFPGKSPVGQTIEWNQGEFKDTYLISAVFKKNPSNASNQFDVLLDFQLFAEKRPGMRSWDNSDPNTYIILKAGTNVASFQHKIRDFLKAKLKDSKSTLFARRFSDSYLYGQYTNGVQTGGRIAYVKLFSIIAIFILVIACINFMNLSTAKASRRIKEVGIQKVMGASRTSLVLQYLGESIFMSFLSLAFAIIIMILLLPVFNNLTDKSLGLHFSGIQLCTILLIALFTGILAGSYPALYISGFKPVAVLKGKLRTSIAELWIRKGLVVFQFTLSIIAIAAVMIIYRQLDYIHSKNLGYNRDNIIHFEIPLELDSVRMLAATTFINELKNIPGVINSSSYYHNLTGEHGGIGGVHWPGKNLSEDISFANLEVGYNFLQTVGIKMKEGRYFSDNSNAAQEIVFNESAIKRMGLKDPVGKTVKFWDQEKQIVGIAQDFNFESLYQSVKPCFFQVYPALPNVIVKIKAGMEKQTIQQINTLYDQFNKGVPFDFRFMDEEYQALYVAENHVAILSKYFTALAIFISCLGLFGLTAFTAQKRQKEIGIRKVVGATVSNVVVLISKDFMQLVLLAACIAFPLVWWALNIWLNAFAYKINFGADVFIIAGGAILLITLVTISFQSIKAALVNPVKSLRSE
jgi:putative ABC transport system permease protein